MKIRIEIEPGIPEEVIIRAPAVTDEILRIQKALENAASRRGELAVHSGEGEIFLSYGEILYFEGSDDYVCVHTAQDCFRSAMRLNELAGILPRAFVRSSKSGIVNTAKIRSITRGPTGVGEASFAGCGKKAYISRMYYSAVRETIEEMRLRK